MIKDPVLRKLAEEIENEQDPDRIRNLAMMLCSSLQIAYDAHATLLSHVSLGFIRCKGQPSIEEIAERKGQ